MFVFLIFTNDLAIDHYPGSSRTCLVKRELGWAFTPILSCLKTLFPVAAILRTEPVYICGSQLGGDCTEKGFLGGLWLSKSLLGQVTGSITTAAPMLSMSQRKLGEQSWPNSGRSTRSQESLGEPRGRRGCAPLLCALVPVGPGSRWGHPFKQKRMVGSCPVVRICFVCGPEASIGFLGCGVPLNCFCGL